ncbi:MAG: CvpA family protein [Betaproteobacteria bacterium]|nr:CvpA family protein [Betaproteobacteria bacterium]
MSVLQSINGFDLVAVIIVVFFVLGSLWRGAIVELFGLIGWVAAFLLARLYADVISAQFFAALSPAFVRTAVAWLSIFIVTLLVAHLLGVIFRQAFAKTGLSTLDRALGGVLGLAKAAVLLLALVWMAGYTPLAKSELFATSTTARLARGVIDLVRQSNGWPAQEAESPARPAKTMERNI